MPILPFTLLSATTNAAAPFCLGHAFVQGEVPSGSQLAAGSVQLQCVVKNAWPDGSMKFAVLAGVASITGGVDLSVTPAIGSPVTGTALALSDLKATGVTASIGCGAFGTASWATTDWDSPFATNSSGDPAWISGPVMASWVYRKAVGSDAHLVAWLEVRMWVGGAVEVLPWIENGYLNVAAPTNKSETYTFTLGGTSRCSVAIDLKHHQRTPIINGAALSYWLGTDPGVTPLHDPDYMQVSKLVPAYSAVLAAGATQVTAQASTYLPLQVGGFVYTSDDMTSTGYSPAIGLLPEHDMLYLVAHQTNRAALFASIIRNGYGSGRYGIHYRDETTQRPAAFSTYPTLVLNDNAGMAGTGSSTTGTTAPTPTGGNPPIWDKPHSPNIGYMAYLLTGRFYFKEEAQFAVIANHFNTTDWVRGGGTLTDPGIPMTGYTGVSGIYGGLSQVRGSAWGFRSLVHALAVTPDSGDPLRAELITCVEENCRYYHQIYVAQSNHPFGFIYDPGTYTDTVTDRHVIAPWQQHFFTATWGRALSLGLPISSTAANKMAEFFQWTAKSAVHVLGIESEFKWRNGAGAYEYASSPALTPDYIGGTGPWYSTAAEVYAASFIGTSNMIEYSAGPNLLGERYPSGMHVSFIGNTFPAIAAAVEHSIPGAAAAYARLMGADNITTITDGFNTQPVWSVTPLSGTTAMTTPGPKMRVGQLFTGKMAVSGFRGTGITAAQNGTGGTEPSLLAQHMVGADPTSEFLWVADDVPAGLDLVIYEDSSAIATAADGVYNGNKTVYTDGAPDPGTYSYTLGTPTSEITGISITPTTATDSVDFDALVSGTGSFSPAFTFSKIGGGSIDPTTGAFVKPAPTGSVQTIVVRATSTQDPTKWAEAVVTIDALVVSRAPRFARPESDVSAGAWVPSSGSSLFAMLDEATADSSDYISTTSASTAVVSLAPVVDPATSVNQVVRYQAWAPTGGTLTVRLKQGSTVIASWAHSPLPTTPTIFAQSLTGPECDSITDYTLLQLEFVAAP